MRIASLLVCAVLALSAAPPASPVDKLRATPSSVEASTVLFIGNSFMFGAGSPVRFYRADTVTDLNDEGIGGVPALFKSFTTQAGLDYDVSLETRAGIGLDFHLAEQARRASAAAPGTWSSCTATARSTPTSRATRRSSSRRAKQMAELLRAQSEGRDLPDGDLVARRSDLSCRRRLAGQPIEAMARDVRAGYDKAGRRRRRSSR